MKKRKFSRLHRLFSSVFTKLIFISLLSWVFIIIAIIASFIISRHDTKGPFYKNASRYIEYVVNDLGTPPQQSKALKLSAATGMHISFLNVDERWSTRPQFPPLTEVRFRTLHGNNFIQVGRKRGQRFFRLQLESGALFFEFAGVDEEDRQKQMGHVFLLILLSVILLCSYLAMKRVLLPLKWLNIGVHQVREGNLSHLVPMSGNNELTDLTRSFNEMTRRLRDMLSAKEHLLRDISHELRSPLTRIRLALELSKEDETKDDIISDIAEMEEMLQNILETARDHQTLHTQNRSRENLTDIILSVTAKYEKSRPPVRFDAPERSFYCLADKKGLQTLLTNCIENGIKFSDELSKPVEIHLTGEGDNGVITIIDHGLGIDEAELPAILEPFYRVDPSRSRRTGGFGLGLSIGKAIIDAHGGSMKISSKKGKGTQIIISLPLIK